MYYTRQQADCQQFFRDGARVESNLCPFRRDALANPCFFAICQCHSLPLSPERTGKSLFFRYLPVSLFTSFAGMHWQILVFSLFASASPFFTRQVALANLRFSPFCQCIPIFHSSSRTGKSSFFPFLPVHRPNNTPPLFQSATEQQINPLNANSSPIEIQ